MINWFEKYDLVLKNYEPELKLNHNSYMTTS